MTTYPVIIILILAVTDWIAADRNIKPLEYFAKPATMLALLWWIWQTVGLGGSMLWFTIGVVFCLVGDVFLMLPMDVFIFGLLSFLLGHIFYIVGLNNTGPYINFLGVLVIILIGVYFGWFYPRLVNGLNQKGKNILKFPVLVYSLVISLMLYSALLSWTRYGWPNMAALSISLGAILFYASDSILAWDRFVNPLSHASLRVIITYHLGQSGIILGAILHAISIK